MPINLLNSYLTLCTLSNVILSVILKTSLKISFRRLKRLRQRVKTVTDKLNKFEYFPLNKKVDNVYSNTFSLQFLT